MFYQGKVFVPVHSMHASIYLFHHSVFVCLPVPCHYFFDQLIVSSISVSSSINVIFFYLITCFVLPFY
jgi:hypothetical protein